MTDLPPERITAFFDRVAADWDEMRLVYYDEAVIERLAAAAELNETMTVADIGTGTGFVAAGLAGRVARVIGIDDSPGMLAEAERNLAELGATNVELHRGDIAALPLPDDSVDAAVANMVLHHATDPAAMLREMTRIVRPGGTVAICDEVTHSYAWMREEHHDVWLGFSHEQVNAFFATAGLEAPSLEVLGRQ
jgi:ubiquinone/menaquinone biosynthesis C-methylase UbiE